MASVSSTSRPYSFPYSSRLPIIERRLVSKDLEYRGITRIVAAIDILSGLGTLGFHTFTIFIQEVTGNNRIVVPLTPVSLGVFGYIVVIAWIGIVMVNILQLCVGFSLYCGSSEDSEATKTLGKCRLWMKTCLFLLILVISKLVILYFLHELGTTVTGTLIWCIVEIIGRLIGLIIVIKFVQELATAFPELTQIYYEAELKIETNEEGKVNPVQDAVWF